MRGRRPAHPAGASAVAELENQVAPRAPTSSNRTATPTPSCTWTFAPSCVFANALQVSVKRGAGDVEVTRLAGGRAGADRIGLRVADRSRDASLDRCSVGGDSCLGTTANPSRVPSDERIAYVCGGDEPLHPDRTDVREAEADPGDGVRRPAPVRGVRERDVRPGEERAGGSRRVVSVCRDPQPVQEVVVQVRRSFRRATPATPQARASAYVSCAHTLT